MSFVQPTFRRSILPRLHCRAMTTQPHSPRDQTFTLPDGRVLGFREVGVPEGRPILYFHGYPSSRVEVDPAHNLAKKHNIRLISLERPGFGISTPQPCRTLLDWPADVRDFARGIGLERFGIMGLSGGGPFAVACAYALPKEMLTSVGLFASGPPWAAGAHHMSLTRRVTSWMASYWPRGLGAVLRLCVSALRAFERWSVGARWIDATLDKLDEKAAKDRKTGNDGATTPPAPKTQEEKAARRKGIMDLLVNEPFRQGTGASVLEAKLLSSQDWGFRFEDVKYGPVRIWHGAKDGNAPIAAIRYLADRLPDSVLCEFEGDTHYTMFAHLDQALREMASDIGEK
ncbi:related to hydrolases or acyltransferases (alpha/beta hydrolase superfamily) [Cephalotrichum gorgonifer]|uniref:Related to hydrolases or acyltransferases (Alpha/beta hydrolase superfamily) n=1 Tax=Cephalotrichum gorgonifer TaxID=2041049 RepID=A0AAE8SZ02_9PEZI|nr:related to hydrolases or acyltransferases (alpha/beta hydrolase superfamily) [Cephalotrichum gorgonifer]